MKETRQQREQRSRRLTRVLLMAGLAVLIGFPLGFLEYQSLKTGKTWAQLTRRLLGPNDEAPLADAPAGAKPYYTYDREPDRYAHWKLSVDGPVATLTWYQRTTPSNYVATSDVFTYSLAPVIAYSYSNGTLTLTWSGGGILQTSSGVTGQWTNMANARSPYVVTSLTGPRTFYRVQLRP